MLLWFWLQTVFYFFVSFFYCSFEVCVQRAVFCFVLFCDTPNGIIKSAILCIVRSRMKRNALHMLLFEIAIKTKYQRHELRINFNAPELSAIWKGKTTETKPHWINKCVQKRQEHLISMNWFVWCVSGVGYFQLAMKEITQWTEHNLFHSDNSLILMWCASFFSISSRLDRSWNFVYDRDGTRCRTSRHRSKRRR